MGKSLAVLVQVVEDEAREVFVLKGRSAERVERSAQRVGTEVVGVGSLIQYFHCTHAIIVACAGLQVVKPDVVLYEEGLDNNTVNSAINAISQADMLIIGGTSLNVYPAASFVDYFHGKYTVLINRDSTPYDRKADLVIHENIGEVMNKILLQ